MSQISVSSDEVLLFNTAHIYHCPFMDCNTQVPFLNEQLFLDHLYTIHHIRILDPNSILPILNEYLSHVLGKNFTTPCTHPPSLSPSSPSSNLQSPILDSIEISPSPSSEISFPIITLGENDQEIRNKLLNDRLLEVLNTQSWERENLYHLSSNCLFCPERLDSKKSLLDHMYHFHSFNLGHLDNLVWIDEYLESLHSKLSNYQCIYCEKTYSNMTNLRRHLKAKRHFRIHSKNHQYDKYYIVNYRIESKENNINNVSSNIDSNKSNKSNKNNNHRNNKNSIDKETNSILIKNEIEMKIENIQSGEFDEISRRTSNSSLSWSDLTDDNLTDYRTQCLFCMKIFSESGDQFFLSHLNEIHQFDYDEFQNSYPDDYDRIKIINYIRNQTRLLKCIRGEKCKNKIGKIGENNENSRGGDDGDQGEMIFTNEQDLIDHYDCSNCGGRDTNEIVNSCSSHRNLDELSDRWNRVEYLFPMYEDDPLLWYQHSK